MRKVLNNIQICGSEFLRGNLAKSHEAVVIISDEVETKSLPKGTALPAIMHCKIGPLSGWDAEMQRNICDFIISHSARGKVLVCSDGGDSRAVAAVIRLLIKLGFNRDDAVDIIKDRTGFEPAREILDSFPDLDEKRMSVIFGIKPQMVKVDGREEAKRFCKSIDLTDDEVEKIK